MVDYLSDFSRQAFLNLQNEEEDLDEYRVKPEFSNYFNLPFGAISSDGSAIKGRLNNFFVNDGSNHWSDQLRGVLPDSVTISNGYLNLINNRKEYLTEKGILYKHIIIPEKDIIYPELSPNLLDRPPSKDRVANLMVSTASSNVLFYPVDYLQSVKPYGYLFHRRNSHYNFHCGFFVFNELLKNIDLGFLQLSDFSYDFYSWPDDLSLKFIKDLNTRRQVLKPNFKEEILKFNGSHVGRKSHFKNDSPRFSDKVILFGDSYSWNPDAGLARFLASVFSEVIFVWHHHIDFQLISDFKPSIVLSQSAERFHVVIPSDGVVV